MVLGVCLHFNVLLAAGRRHGEAPDLGAVVIPDGLLLRIKSHSLPNEVPAAIAPHIERHLKADDQDALVELLGTLAQRVLSIVLHNTQSFSMGSRIKRNDILIGAPQCGS